MAAKGSRVLGSHTSVFAEPETEASRARSGEKGTYSRELRLAGRLNPYVAGALAAIDVAVISKDAYNCFKHQTPQ